MQRQVSPGQTRPTRIRTRTRMPGANRVAPERINNTNIVRVNAPALPTCVFDGPFLSICYNRRPVCRSDEITCRKDKIFCCFKPLCDILPTTTTPAPPVDNPYLPVTTITPPQNVEFCAPRGNYVLVNRIDITNLKYLKRNKKTLKFTGSSFTIS